MSAKFLFHVLFSTYQERGRYSVCICFRIVLSASKCLVNLLPLTNVSSSETMTLKFPALQFQAEGIFHINLENDQEEHVRDQLNKGVVPEDISVHCYIGFLFDFPSHCVCENVFASRKI